MLFMVIERFKNGDAKAVGERFARQGRMLPEGVEYRASWVDAANARCFQLMEAQDLRMLAGWTSHWSDLVDFEIVLVLTSQEYWATTNPNPTS